MRIGLSLGLTAARGAGGIPPAKTYADWVAHINARAVNGSLDWDALVAVTAGVYTTTAAPVGLSFMEGSPWLSKFAGSGTRTRGSARVVQHGLPSQTVFNDQIASARKIFLSYSSTSAENPVGLNRNGYSSLSSGSPLANLICTEVSYWYDGAPWAMNPRDGTGPTPYAAAGW